MTAYFLRRQVLGDLTEIPISRERFQTLESAWTGTATIVSIEEYWDIIVSNYVLLETHLFEISMRYMISRFGSYEDFQNARVVFSSDLSNLLGSCRAYLDQTASALNTIDPASDLLKKFRVSAKREYDGRKGYRIMEALRNYSQHCGLPLHGASYRAKRIENDKDYNLHYSVLTKIDTAILSEGNFKKSVLSEVSGVIDSHPFLKDYLEGLSKIHEELRADLESIALDFENKISEAIVEFADAQPEQLTLGLSAVKVSDSTIVKEIPLHSLLPERVRKLIRKNRPLNNLLRRVVANVTPPIEAT